jgi:glycine/D-amino acid oxidase-like deaminating enzyme
MLVYSYSRSLLALRNPLRKTFPNAVSCTTRLKSGIGSNGMGFDGQVQQVHVIGAGLAGLSVVYNLMISKHPFRIKLYDQYEPGMGGASNAATLMHMFTPSGKIIYKGEEGLECSLQMIDFATRSANSDGSDDHDISELAKAISVTRLCFTDKSYQNWKSSAESYPEWIEQQVIDPAEFALDDQVDKPIASFLIKKAYAVETTKYLQSLWRTVQEKAHSFNCEVEYSKVNVKYITDIRDDPGDIVILANGAGCMPLWDQLSNHKENNYTLPFNYVRGQNILFNKSSTNNNLNDAVLCGEYIVPMEDRIICGATHEYGELNTLLEMSPDLNKAQKLLYDRINRLDQKIMKDQTPYMSNQGIRVVPPRSHFGRLPVIANHPVDRKVWLLSGLSSRGLIHHGLLGSYVSRSIVDKETENIIIPKELLLEFDR